MKGRASLRRLKLSNFKLNTLLEITQAINDNLSTEELIKRYERILCKELNIGKLVVFSFNKKWRRILVSGFNNDEIEEKSDILECVFQYNDITNLAATSKPETLDPFDVIIPVYHKNTALAYVLIGDIEEERTGISPTIKHLHFIQTLTNVIIVAIENKRLFNENLRQEGIKKELELASKMQSMLIPASASLPSNKKIHVVAHYEPHFEVGGDYYDFIYLNKNEVGFCIADVSGKGISAALLMSNFQASLRALFTDKISLKQLVKKLNNIVMSTTGGEKFITLFIAKYNFSTKKLKYINAGHNPPVMYRVKDQKISLLKNGCIGLGMFKEIPVIKEGNLVIGSRTKLLCYTDGLVEVENDNKIEFGTSELEVSIANHKKIEDVLSEIVSKLGNYKGGKSFFDDISIIGLEFF